MPSPATAWDQVRIYGTWHGMDGALLAGKYTVTFPARVTDASDDTIIPAGVFAANVPLNTTAGLPSLDFMCPATDDPDIAETGWKVNIVVTFDAGAAKETYILDVPYANRPVESGGNGLGVNLRTVALSQSIPQQLALYKVGVPGGLAQLNSAGEVVDANGDPVTGGGGVSALTDLTDVAADSPADGDALVWNAGNSDWEPGSIAGGAVSAGDISDATEIGVDLLTAGSQSAARTAIGAGTSSFDGTYASLSDKPTIPSTVADIEGAAPLESPAFTGTPTVPTASVGTSTTQAASTAFVAAAVAALVAGAPAALDTLNELAAALGDDANYAATITTALAGKLATSAVNAANGVAGLDANGHTSLAVLPSGSVIHVESLDGGTTWKDLAGNTITGRPTSRTDVRVACETTGTTLPSWAVTGDLLLLIED